MRKTLTISLELVIKGKQKGKIRVNISDSCGNGHIIYGTHYSEIIFNHKCNRVLGDKS
jgi:hypothetical protein